MRLAIALTLFVVACGGTTSTPGDPCTDPPTYVKDLKLVIDARCVTCHSKDKESLARKGAPVGLDFDTYELILPKMKEFLSEFTSGREPPSSVDAADRTTAEERTLVATWQRCSYPER